MSASCDEATRRLSTDAVFPWGRWVSDDSVVKRRRRCKGTALVNAVTGDGVRISADRNPSAQEREARSLAHRDADMRGSGWARRRRSVGAFWRSDLALIRTTYYAGRSMSDARFLVLVSLSDGPRHGYSIQHDIEAFAGARLGAGTLYGAINTLERDQLIEALPTTERRRPYRLTSAGRHHLRQQLEMLDRIRARTAAVKLA